MLEEPQAQNRKGLNETLADESIGLAQSYRPLHGPGAIEDGNE